MKRKRSTAVAAVGAAAVAAATLLGLPAGALAADGGQVWTNAGCGACHTLNVTGSRARVGPNLDELAPTAAEVSAKVRAGGSGMPSFATKLTSAQIDAVAGFVAANAGRLPGQPAVSGTVVAAATGPLPAAAPWVLSLQRKLAALGLFSGPQTGVYGPVTTAAVKAFQIKAGLTPDGRWGSASQAALDKALTTGAAASTTAAATTKAPATTSAPATTTPAAAPAAAAAPATSSTFLPAPAAWVKSLQQKLARLGYFSGPANGVLGPVTQAAIKTFQANASLTPDGKWGPASQVALDKALAAKTG